MRSWQTLLFAAFLVVIFLLGTGSAEASDWPDYRGPRRDGKSPAMNVPLKWSESENVVWKTPIHDQGHSSPVVLGRHVWLTTATADGKDMFVLCVDRETGEILLDKKIFQNKRPRPLGNNVNNYATPSPVIEGGRVYVHFGSYGTACLDTQTFEVLWQRRDLPCDHWRGPGSSPCLYEDLLLLHFDGANVQYAAALDKNSGETRWVTFRSADFGDLDEEGRPLAGGDGRKSYGTPDVIGYGGRAQMISTGAKATYSYDARTGQEIWVARHQSHSAGARTVFGSGLALTFTGVNPTELVALRMDGEGDVTDTHVAWKSRRGVPSRSSPVLVDNLLYMASENGVATCLDITASSEPVWQERLGGRFSASLVHLVGRLYFFDESGVTTVIKPGRKFHRLQTNRLDGGFMASPAIAGRSLYLRSRTHLYRIGE